MVMISTVDACMTADSDVAKHHSHWPQASATHCLLSLAGLFLACGTLT